jgi:hypothetical protein
VEYLSVSESPPARSAAGLNEWEHDLAEDVALPSRVGARSPEGWPLHSAGDGGHLRGVAPHPRRLAPPTERYRRGCSEVSVLIRRRFVRTLPRFALPTEGYRRGSFQVSAFVRRRFVSTSLGGRCQPKGIAEDPSRCRPSSDEGSCPPPSVGGANRTVSPRMCRGVRLDPTKVRAHPRRLALSTERYRQRSSEVSVLIRRRFARTLLGWRCQPNGIAEDPPRCPSWTDEGSCGPSSVGAANPNGIAEDPPRCGS